MFCIVPFLLLKHIFWAVCGSWTLLFYTNTHTLTHSQPFNVTPLSRWRWVFWSTAQSECPRRWTYRTTAGLNTQWFEKTQAYARRAELYPLLLNTVWWWRAKQITVVRFVFRCSLVVCEEEKMRLRSQKVVSPRLETPRSNRRTIIKATPKRTRLSVAESPLQTKVTNWCLLHYHLNETLVIV